MTMRIRGGAAVIAAVLMASGAFAQTVATPEATAQPDAVAAPEVTAAPAPEAAPAADAAPMAADAAPMQQDAMAAPMLEQRDGTWMNGDKPATPTEIAEYKKAEKAKPKN